MRPRARREVGSASVFNAPRSAKRRPMDDDADPPALPPSGVQHGHPPEGLECLATFEDITSEDGNYVEYQTAPHFVKTCRAHAVSRGRATCS